MSEEVRFQREVIKSAQAMGWRVYFTKDSRGSPKGFPDLVLVKPPRVVFAELKSTDGRLRPEQLEWLNVLKQCRIMDVEVWKPGNWDEAIKILER